MTLPLPTFPPGYRLVDGDLLNEWFDSVTQGGGVSVGGGAPPPANIPPMMLFTQVSSATAVAHWPDDGSPLANFPFQWTVTVTVQAQQHSSPATPTPYYYTATDVKVGDWFAGYGAGIAWIVRSITSSDSGDLVCVMEDVNQYNSYSNPTTVGDGGVSIGPGFFFRLTSAGVPILTPGVISSLGPDAGVNLIGRFAYTQGS